MVLLKKKIDDYKTKIKISTNMDKYYKRQYERLIQENRVHRLKLIEEVYTLISTIQFNSTNLYLKLFN